MHSPHLVPRLFTADEYHKMAEAGILDEDDRVELIDGEIVQMSPIGSAHANSVNRLAELFIGKLAGRVTVSIQNPVRLTSHSEPEPDVALLKRHGQYKQHLPMPQDILLIVEVSDSTIDNDRRVKVPLYARSDIPQVIIVDIEGDAIENYENPAQGAYTNVQRVERGSNIRITALNHEISVDDLLGD